MDDDARANVRFIRNHESVRYEPELKRSGNTYRVLTNSSMEVPIMWAEAIDARDAELRAASQPKTTRELRAYHLRRFAADHADLNPDDITRDHLVTWLGGHQWKPNTTRSYRASLKTFFAWLHAIGRINTNPAATLPAVRVGRAVPRPAPNEVVNNALMRVPDRERLMLLILAYSGCRRGELARMRGTHAVAGIEGHQLRIRGKGDKVRVVPIPDAIARAIMAHGDDWLFPSPHGGHLTVAHVGKLVSQSMPEGWTAHTIRHRYGTVTYNATRDLLAVRELMGHEKIETTQGYTLVDPESLRTTAMAAGNGLIA